MGLGRVMPLLATFTEIPCLCRTWYNQILVVLQRTFIKYINAKWGCFLSLIFMSEGVASTSRSTGIVTWSFKHQVWPKWNFYSYQFEVNCSFASVHNRWIFNFLSWAVLPYPTWIQWVFLNGYVRVRLFCQDCSFPEIKICFKSLRTDIHMLEFCFRNRIG